MRFAEPCARGQVRSAPLEIGVPADQAVEKQNTIEMIDLVLGDARFEAAHRELAGFAVPVERFEFDFFCANHLAGVIRHRKAAFAPYGKAIPVDDLRVDEHERAVVFNRPLGFGGIDNANALQRADLRRGNADGARAACAGFEQMVDKRLQFGAEIVHRIAGGFQPLIRVGKNR